MPGRRATAGRLPRTTSGLPGCSHGIGPDEVLGEFGLIMGGTAGDEIDRADPALGTPPDAWVLATSTGHSDCYQLAVEEVQATTPGLGGSDNELVRSDIVLFETPSGGAVFAAGSICFCGALSHAGYDNNISRMVGNVVRAFLRRSAAAGFAGRTTDVPEPVRVACPSRNTDTSGVARSGPPRARGHAAGRRLRRPAGAVGLRAGERLRRGPAPPRPAQGLGQLLHGPAPLPSVVGTDGVGRLEDGTRVYFDDCVPPYGSMAERTLDIAIDVHPRPLDQVAEAWERQRQAAGGPKTVLVP